MRHWTWQDWVALIVSLAIIVASFWWVSHWQDAPAPGVPFGSY